MSENTHPFYDMHAHGFVRVATATPCHRTGDVAFNVKGILAQAHKAHDQSVDLVVYPELCVSSYTLDDLHLQNAMLDRSEAALADIAEASAELTPVLIVGAPLRRNAKIYNCAIVIAGGEILGVIPKSYLPNYREFYEKRYFAHGRNCQDLWIGVDGEEVPFGTDLVFSASNISGFTFGVEILRRFLGTQSPRHQSGARWCVDPVQLVCFAHHHWPRG